ncbi:Zinc finger, LIM-type [Acididesulfobacillus acetoxydans]|uniref:Zinc finger, LIM-type n=1 Tax=Acididesulfobacillus acetoxydans TaxID=1561005 RepID=A0A8S0X050_9FIRM|nr:Zinc finger, LIM-type [Acididesulfobacillus acetoxydans]CEJ08394.1 Hypothetical protein DEACI_2870 [Acididesulfobacillus acetoxydans]
MAVCAKCGQEVSDDDLYEDHGLLVCDDCKVNGTRPISKPCGGES